MIILAVVASKARVGIAYRLNEHIDFSRIAFFCPTFSHLIDFDHIYAYRMLAPIISSINFHNFLVQQSILLCLIIFITKILYS